MQNFIYRDHCFAIVGDNLSLLRSDGDLVDYIFFFFGNVDEHNKLFHCLAKQYL